MEFAVDEKGAGSLAKLFSGMGFTRAGEHISKDVTRWTQGGINLVINSEKEGFAHSHYITHGTSVCALGLKVDDAAATLDRAKKLHDTPFRQPVRPGDQVSIHVEKIHARKLAWKFSGECRVDGRVVADAVYTAMIVDRK